MTRRPTDRDLDRLLAELPRETASAGFSRRVLDGLGRPAAPRTGRRLLVAAAVAAGTLAVGVWLVPRPAPEPTLAETRALQEEHRRLVEELESLKASLRESRAAPVLYLGGNESVDLVLDLGPVWQGEPAGDFRPAVYEGAEAPVIPGDRRTGDRR